MSYASSLVCRDNKSVLKSNVLSNANFDFEQQPARFLIDHTKVDVTRVITLGLEYLKLLSTTLCKLVVYSNSSDDEDEITKFTIKYNSCHQRTSVNHKGLASKVVPNDVWVVRFTMPMSRASLNANRMNNSLNNRGAINNAGKNSNRNASGNASIGRRKLEITTDSQKVINLIMGSGLVNMVELHKRGIKVSDDSEVLTLYYTSD